MEVSIFGIGYVGAVSAVCLARAGHRIIAVDNNPEKVAAINRGQTPVTEPGLEEEFRHALANGRLSATTDADAAIQNSEISLVCVGTPSLSNGDLDLSQIKRVCQDIGASLVAKQRFHAVIIRSTMLPGSLTETVQRTLEAASGKLCGHDFGLVSYPEFLREGSAIQDYEMADMLLFGCTDHKTEMQLRELTQNLRADVEVTDPAIAEAVKLASNAWHATKIVFANEIGAFCRELDIDSHEVMRILCADGRLNLSSAYLRPGFSYGGSCLPKDLRALHYKATSNGLKLPLLAALPESNDLPIERVIDLVKADKGRKIGLLGLAFKKGTDDLRESPAVILAERLIARGYELLIFDRMVNCDRLTGANRAYIETHLPHLATLLNGDIQALADHADILITIQDDLGEAEFPTLRPDQLVIDVARIPAAKTAGARYAGLCW